MEIRDIKKRQTIKQALKHYKLKPDNNNRLNCPFHNDKTPSMQVYHETNTVYCFSSNCKTHGKSLDVIDFIMHMENCTKHQAILKAKELIGELPINQEKKSQPITVHHSRITILEKIFKSFRNGMFRSSTAQEYAKERNLDHETLEIGYNSGQFHHRGRLSQEEFKACVEAGLLMEYSKPMPKAINNKTYSPFANNCC